MNGNKCKSNICLHFLLTKPNISSIILSVKKIAENKRPTLKRCWRTIGQVFIHIHKFVTRTDKNLKHSGKTMLDDIITYLICISQVISSISAKLFQLFKTEYRNILCGCVGIGRRYRLKICWCNTVRVQVPEAPLNNYQLRIGHIRRRNMS